MIAIHQKEWFKVNFKLKQHIKNFKPESYVKESDCDDSSTVQDVELIDCALGVNPYGYSDAVDRLFEGNSLKCDLSSYPQHPYPDLKAEIVRFWAGRCSIQNRNIRFGSGSIDVLRNINRAFVGKGTRVLGLAPTFTSYPSDVELCEGVFEYELLSKNENFKFDAEKFLSRITPEHTLVYIDNPNNPTGQVIPLEDIKRILDKALENDVCVLVDEAYGDFMDIGNSAVPLVDSYENLMVTRTFSKGFGLAGLRIGYVVSGEYLSEIISKVDTPFQINSVGHLAAAAALKDKQFISESMLKICRAKAGIYDALEKIKVLETDSEVPIMTLFLPDEDTDLHGLFMEKGVLTESGEDFHGLGKNFVRMRVPKDSGKLISIISTIESSI
jgi:histidinol-phosphate aminotransferase